MASGSARVVAVVIDTSVLAEACGKAAKPLVNKRADEIMSRVQGMSAGFYTGRFYDRTEKKLKGHTAPRYGVKHADSNTNPHAIVYTANYAAMKFELQNNGLLKASR